MSEEFTRKLVIEGRSNSRHKNYLRQIAELAIHYKESPSAGETIPITMLGKAPPWKGMTSSTCFASTYCHLVLPGSGGTKPIVEDGLPWQQIAFQRMGIKPGICKCCGGTMVIVQIISDQFHDGKRAPPEKSQNVTLCNPDS